MKYFILFFICLFYNFFSNLQAQNSATLKKTDISQLLGTWKGSLTYLDYNSGKPFTMPANTIISLIPNSNNLLMEMIYPDEPKANSKDTLMVDKAYTLFDGYPVVSRKVVCDDSIETISNEEERRRKI